MGRLRKLVSNAGVAAALFPGILFAQGAASNYPAKPVLMIISVAPGGPTDVEARLYAPKMAAFVGQPFIIDYKPGAGTTIGAAYVAKAAPDGYTLLVATSGLTSFPALYKNLPFDVIRDFAPISLMSQRTSVLLVSPSFPPRNFAEYLAYAKANPGKINFGTAGIGTNIHLAGEWLGNATKTKVTFVHYKGTGPLMLDLVAGRLDAAPTPLLTGLPLIRSGKARALVIMNSARSKLLPGVLTVAEQGVPGYDFASWLGFSAPGATSPAIVNKLSEAFAKVAKSPDVAAPLEADGGRMVGSTPAQFRQLIVAETERWKKVVQEAGIKIER